MYFKKGLHGVTGVNVRARLCEVKYVKGKEEGWKCLDQGGGRNKGGTHTMHEGLCSSEAKEITTSGHGKNADQEYGGLDGGNGSGGKNGRVQSGGKRRHGRRHGLKG